MKSHVLSISMLIFILIGISCKKENNPPVINDQVFSVKENSPNGKVLGKVDATDPDRDHLFFEIVTDNEKVPFTIESSTGELSVKNSQFLNFEKITEVKFIVQVSDNNEHSLYGRAMITIVIEDIDEMPNNGLVAYFPFNGNAEDESDLNNQCTVYNAKLTSDRYGREDKAYYLDGLNDKLEITHSNNLNFDGGVDSYSINIWVKSNDPTNGNANYGRLFSKWNEYLTDKYPFVLQYNSNSCMGLIYHGEQSNKSVVNYSNFWDNNWHMITFVVNNTNRYIYSYVDGNLQETSVNKATAGTTNSLNIIIGYCWPNSVYYKGDIDDISVYNRALSQEEINLIYNQ